MEQPQESFPSWDLRDNNLQHDHSAPQVHRNLNSSILTLPDEILISIFELAFPRLPTSYWDDGLNKTSIVRCAQICKRFYRILIPSIYHTVQIKAAMNPECIRNIHATVQNNSSIAQYCKDLRVSLDPDGEDYNNHHFGMVDEVIKSFVNVKLFSMVGGNRLMGSPKVLTLVRHALSGMNSAQHVHLSWGALAHVGILNLPKVLCSPSLTKLDLGGSFFSDDQEFTVQDTEYQNTDSVNLSEISISHYQDSYRVLYKLLQWPRQLSKFAFFGPCFTHTNLDLPRFRHMLLKHKSTLRSLHIGRLPRSQDGIMLSLNDFSALEELTISKRNMRPDLQRGSEEANLILGPRLKKFNWDFGMAPGRETWDDFGYYENLWIRDFAQEVVKKNSPCKTLRILFNPGEPRRKSDGYPWELMKGLNEEFCKEGIDISWTKPYMTKGEWREWAESFEGDWPR